ncbi:zeta toxin family protein [Pedobacter sp. 22226]|uniref:zeta toxin family protein n=1 Tax=Pedobacter sp. 22226 TaxID=3453894 RepID=UPI003F8263CE
MNIPKLFIVAGPNGAGKSLFSAQLTESDFIVFDGDKHMTAIRRKFPEIGSEALWSYVDEHIFQVEKKEAISAKLNYAFETNFSSSDPMASMREFKNAGYQIHMVFMGINSIEESIQRVEDRVRMGGHKVTEDSIRYNFEHGLKNLYQYFSQFDSVTFYDNAISETNELQPPKEIAYIINQELHHQGDEFPDWFLPLLGFFAAG